MSAAFDDLRHVEWEVRFVAIPDSIPDAEQLFAGLLAQDWRMNGIYEGHLIMVRAALKLPRAIKEELKHGRTN